VPRRVAPDDLDRLAATLNRMLDRTSSLTESLKHLSNDIAHDLRTPLGRLRRQLDTARMQALSPGECQEVLDKSVGELDDILGMFSAILRVAQIESGSRRSGFQHVCLSTLVADICDTFGPAFEEDGHILRHQIEPDLWINGDQELVTLSLANLLENASTHTPLNSSITVSLHKSRGGIELDVSDDGPGVPEGERKRIFQRFYRLETSRTTAGNGLGLSIVAAVADLHKAEINAGDNHPGLKVAILFPAA
jgi:signal transduction histidine kinase